MTIRVLMTRKVPKLNWKAGLMPCWGRQRFTRFLAMIRVSPAVL